MVFHRPCDSRHSPQNERHSLSSSTETAESINTRQGTVTGAITTRVEQSEYNDETSKGHGGAYR